MPDGILTAIPSKPFARDGAGPQRREEEEVVSLPRPSWALHEILTKRSRALLVSLSIGKSLWKEPVQPTCVPSLNHAMLVC